MSKARVLVLLFKLEIPQASGSSVLAYMTDRTDTVQRSQQHNKPNPKTFHKDFCKPGVNLEGLI